MTYNGSSFSGSNQRQKQNQSRLLLPTESVWKEQVCNNTGVLIL